jgi:heptosyltransferase-2
MRILIVQTAFLGDVVLTLPLVQALQQHVPDARIDLLTTPGNAPVLQGQPEISAVITYDKRGTQRGLHGFVELVHRLRSQRYDIALSPHRSLRSALLLACSGIPCRVGFSRNLTNWAYTHTIQRPTSGHEVEKNLRLLTPFKQPDAPLNQPSPPRERGQTGTRTYGHLDRRSSATRPGQLAIHVSIAARQRARDVLSRHGIQAGQVLVGMIPGSQWGTKRWPPEHFAALIDQLASQGQVRAVLFGGPQDRSIADAIVAACQTPVVDLVGQTPLQELAAYLDCCTVVVSNDTGPMHIAAALGRPIVALYGPTTPALGFYPYGTPWQEASVSLDCRPCHAHGPHRCPLSHWRCMRDLNAEHVLDAVQQLRSQTHPLTRSGHAHRPR